MGSDSAVGYSKSEISEPENSESESLADVFCIAVYKNTTYFINK